MKIIHLMVKIREFLTFLIFLSILPLLKQMMKIRNILFFSKQTLKIIRFLTMTQRFSQSDAAKEDLANKFQKKISFLHLIFIFLATFSISIHT